MDRQKLIENVPFIYHLTDRRNLKFILETKSFFSTKELVNKSNVENKDQIIKKRRPVHCTFIVNENEIWIRDQRPLNAALEKCLTGGWSSEQFIYTLNCRVFFWPNLKRLKTHFERYKNENPVIFKIELKKALELNSNAELCHLNSGATVPQYLLGGIAPLRGPDTFLSIEKYDKGINNLAEVTFTKSFNLPNGFFISESPNGNWREQFI
ncbi:MAG: hypothetical protein Q8M15_16875 [Bacteroidota bacterium]|nr:hypothetical protein [Bacteroidota bacterium]